MLTVKEKLINGGGDASKEDEKNSAATSLIFSRFSRNWPLKEI